MIGIIVAGHGHFGSGLTSSLELIAGPQDNYAFIDFDGTGEEKLTKDIRKALEELADCEGILVLCDLPGGSPFKMAVLQSQGLGHVEVIGGANLPMLCEMALARTMISDLETLTQSALSIGREQIIRFANASYEEESEEDGI